MVGRTACERVAVDRAAAVWRALRMQSHQQVRIHTTLEPKTEFSAKDLL
jgi:hypothetical protein